MADQGNAQGTRYEQKLRTHGIAVDASASVAPSAAPSRFRSAYRALTPEEAALCAAITVKAAEFEALIDLLSQRGGAPGSWRYKALALEALEVSVMWAIKGVTA